MGNSAQRAQHYQDNRKRLLAKQAQYYQDNREAIAAHQKQYYQDNRETILTKKAQYHQDNREARAVYQAQYGKANRERLRPYYSQWCKDNREARVSYEANRYARKLNQFVENVDREVAFLNDAGICQWQYCQESSPFVDQNNWHLDHIVALSRGGEHSYANTQVTHPVCNMRKGNS